MNALVRPDNPRAIAAGQWVDERLTKLKNRKASAKPGTKGFSPEYAVLSRVQPFAFAAYPDDAVPWHLIQWPTMRWLHVFYVVTIIESLKQAKGGAAGQPIRLMPFQVLIILCFLGPEHPETGRRVVREGLLTLARKGAKTTLIAAIVLALMVLEKANHGLYGQEVVVGASDREQAGIMFDIINRFVLQDRVLGISELFRSVPSRKHMTHKTTLTEFQVVSSDAYRSQGRNSAISVIDEIGNLPAGAASEFYSVLTSGYGAQKEPLTLLLSTQAPNDTHLFSQMVDRAKRANRGEETAAGFAGFVFDTPERLGKATLDPHDERYWYLANPGLGVSPSLEDMRAESEKAKALPSLEAAFRNLRLNQRENLHAPLLSKSAWMSCDQPVDYEALRGRKCWGALDLSSVRDLTAFVLVFEAGPGDEGRMPVLPFFWLPGEGISVRQNELKVPLVLWQSQGFINCDSNKTIDYELIAAQIDVCISEYDVKGIGFDRWRIEDLKARLRERGLGSLCDDATFMQPIGQGFKDANGCIEALERAVLEGRLKHGAHPVLTWCSANAVVAVDPAGNRKWERVKSYGKIDGIVALAMAVRVKELLTQVVEAGPSSFESDLCLM